MSAVAPNNRAAASATTTFLLAVMVTSSWCLASAIPGSEGRRLQQDFYNSLPTKLEGLSSGAANLNQKVQDLKVTVTPLLPADDFLSQVQQGASDLAAATSRLQTTVQTLLATTDVLAAPSVQATLEGLLSQLSTDLQTFAARLQSPPPADGCFTILQADLLTAISDLLVNLQAAALGVPASSSLQPQLLLESVQNMKTDAGKVNPCSPGLLVLQSHGEGVLDEIYALIAAIQ